jgi:hypothetical protein
VEIIFPSPSSAELAPTQEEQEHRLYFAFKNMYPSHRFDEGKSKNLFERLSLADDNGRFIPFASNWLKSYDTDPPPLFTKPVDELQRKRAESISRVAELTRAYQERMR